MNFFANIFQRFCLDFKNTFSELLFVAASNMFYIGKEQYRMFHYCGVSIMVSYNTCLTNSLVVQRNAIITLNSVF